MFILDEFDLFAKPFKQTVLYNLLDALQTSTVQVRPLLQAAECLSSMHELLEKNTTALLSLG